MINPRFEKEAFKKEVEQNVKQLFRKTVDEASQQELYQAVSYVVKDAIIDDWIATQNQYGALNFLGNDINGTARFVGMGGAMSAPGVDLSPVQMRHPG